MAPTRVLIADPDPESVRPYADTLPRLGFEVELAHTGLDCLDGIRRFEPHVLVLNSKLLWGGPDGILAVLEEDHAVRPQVVLLLRAGSRPPAGFPGMHRVAEWFDHPPVPRFLAHRVRRLLTADASSLIAAPATGNG